MASFFDEKENMPVDDRRRLQDQQLAEMVRLGYNKSAYIKKLFDDLQVKPSEIKTLDDIQHIPVISRERLVEMEMSKPPYGGLTPADTDIDRIFISPGPVYEPHLHDADYLWARAYFAAGIRKGDIVLNAFSYHMVAAGLTFHGGLRRVGATVIPSGTSGTQVQVQLIRDLGVTVYTGTPSFLMAIIQKAQELGHDFKKDFKLRRACFAAEPLAPSLRTAFEQDYAIDTYQMYGATEVGDVAYECSQKKGWHICEEALVEIVDSQTGRRVPPGTYGEIVVTRFNSIFFLFRFGTGDLSRLIEEPCPCGRTSYRLDGIAGRVGEAVKIRGLFVAPSQLRKIIEKYEGLKLQLVVERTGHEDILALRIERKDASPDAVAWEEKFLRYFKEICTVRVDRIEYIKPGTLTPEDKLIVDKKSWPSS
jgi:phenylacetate-CoA ligase